MHFSSMTLLIVIYANISDLSLHAPEIAIIIFEGYPNNIELFYVTDFTWK